MANSEKREIFCILKFKTIYPDCLSQELLEAFKTTFRTFFTVVFRLKLGRHTFIVRIKNINTTTTKPPKSISYMTLNFLIVNIIPKY